MKKLSESSWRRDYRDAPPMNTCLLLRLAGKSLHSLMARGGRVAWRSFRRRRVHAALLATVCVVASLAPSQADLVIFKDGFSVQGKIKRESTPFVDSASGTQLVVPKLNGFFMLDDGARLIRFSPRQVQDVPDKGPARVDDTIQLTSSMVRRHNFKVPPWQFISATDWDKKWDRWLTVETPNGRQRLDQHLRVLTPKVACIEARSYIWPAWYLTREFDPDTVYKLLADHPELKTTGSTADPGKRFRIYRFLVQAGWYDKAAAELDTIVRESPEQKEKVETAREGLKKLLAYQFVDLLEEAHKNGRHHWVQAKLASFPQEGMEEKLIARIDALRATYETANKKLTLARRYLDELPGRLTDPVYRALFKEAAAAIRSELDPDTVSRLEAFIGLAKQAEQQQQQQQHRTPDQTPEQLLALAISGWHLGNSSSESKVETAVRLWRSRQFVLDYQRAPSAGSRQHLVAAYDSKQGVPVDELAQVIRSLPPPEPFDQIQLKKEPWAAGALPFRPAALYWGLLATQKLLPPMTYSLRAESPANFRKGPSYLLRLPSEYHQTRSYPVLFVLHEGGEKPEDMLKRWSTLAAQHGYFLVSPQWSNGLSKTYEYSAEEHQAVLEVLRDLRRHFQIDSDRVFLFGLGEGANMAYDVGLSHPDLFAGVLTMGGAPHTFAKAYKQNAQYLPFYVVDGNYDGDTAKENRQQFEYWVGHSFYPALYVQYKGRGREWFDGELPSMFDWMGRKKRAAPFPELGHSGSVPGYGEEFRSMRPTDNHFYWLSGEGLHDQHINNARKWNSKIGPAYLQARSSEGNRITVHAHGFKRITVWLRPEMVDFDKPVQVFLNSGGLSKRKVTPDLATLLEDFYQRGDRQQLFFAKLEFNP